MAKAKSQSGTIDQHNAESAKARADALFVARDLNPNKESTAVLIRRLADEAECLRVEGKAINERRKALFDEAESNGIDRAAFRHHLKKLRMESEKRAKYERTQRECDAAFGFNLQQDLFADIAPPGNVEDEHDRGIDAGLAAAIEKGWIKEDELSTANAH